MVILRTLLTIRDAVQKSLDDFLDLLMAVPQQG
jgi:hypothetical protein